MTAPADFEPGRFEDILQHTAQIILEQHQAKLPDLSSIKVILPNNNVCNTFRLTLLDLLPEHTSCIIPPTISSLRDYLYSVDLDDTRGASHISDESRRLLFIETLDHHPDLYNDENKWQVTASLLSLFDELYLSTPDILDLSEDEWLTRLSHAYQIDRNIKHLRHEASLIQTLWLAWQQQLDANGLIDPVRGYVNRLKSAEQANSTDYLYIIDTDGYSAAEYAFFDKLRQQGRCTIVRRNEAVAPEDKLAQFIDRSFDLQRPLKNRFDGLQLHREDIPLAFFPASSDESEADAVDLQIRKWLLDGKNHLGIICENRKLSRRIRALLERAGVNLQDISGWSLATSSAAAVLESWLQCIEEDFDHRALLDLLKSHFFAAGSERAFHEQAVYRLEHDIILHENIGSDITRYRKHLKYRKNRLGHWPSDSYTHIEQLLDKLAETGSRLSTFACSGKKNRLSDYLDELLLTLETLGISESFALDDAGITIMSCLRDMKNGLAHSDPTMLWRDFRIWLGINMESRLFIPETESSPVSLLTLRQSELMRFDALIIAATDKQHFPGSPANSPFFNQGVRRSLGLDDWEHEHQRRLDQFQQLLFSADDILITFKNEDKGEAIPLSPWVSTLRNNLKLIFDDEFTDPALLEAVSLDTSVTDCDVLELPPVSARPAIVVPGALIPGKFSARSHQSLINCPYMYFVEDALSLKPSEEISDELQKSDYGHLIHRVLQVFHLPSAEDTGNDKLKPFGRKLTHEYRQEAIAHLELLSDHIFRYDLENNALHKSWLHRWKKQIPFYVDWQIDHQQDWEVLATERRSETRLADGTTLFGRIDRIDKNTQRKQIIDYKTGGSARQEAVDSAEDVQLITYSLLEDDVDSVFYLKLDDIKSGIKQGAELSGETLETLKTACRSRLENIIQMIHRGHTLQAWGDEQVCSYCRFAGICRKPFWSET